jgi:hypothetical protein
VSLALLAQILIDATSLEGLPTVLTRKGVPAAALLIPGGFFFSSTGRGVTEPNRFIALIWLGAVVLGIGVVSLGIGLLT